MSYLKARTYDSFKTFKCSTERLRAHKMYIVHVKKLKLQSRATDCKETKGTLDLSGIYIP